MTQIMTVIASIETSISRKHVKANHNEGLYPISCSSVLCVEMEVFMTEVKNN